MPGNGRFLLEGLSGTFNIQVNRPDNIWETTAAKFSGEPAESLIGRVVQIRLSGPREAVRRLRPVPTDFGIQLQGGPKDQFQAPEGSPSVSAFRRRRSHRGSVT